MCAAVTYQSITKHLDDNHIHFSFLIKKNCKETLNIKASAHNDKPKAVVPKPNTHAVQNKGILKSNNSKKGQSIPDVKSQTTVILKYENPPMPLEDSFKNLQSKPNSQPPEYSSINKGDDEKHFKSPAHCTSAINKDNDDLVSKFFLLFFICQLLIAS